MFSALTEKLTGVFNRITNRGLLTENDIDTALRDIRIALLEADVNFRAVRNLITQIRNRSIKTEILQSLSPGTQVVNIVYEELASMLSHGGEKSLISSTITPSVIILMGLQGSGKTTSAAKLALHLSKEKQHPMLLAADLRRPAAVEQLVALGNQISVPVYAEDTPSTAIEVCHNGIKHAKSIGASWVIVDTSGRLHIDDELMGELEDIKAVTKATESLLVVDAMTGQDALRAAEAFHQRIGLTGIILSKLDGDARGGAALSVTYVTGVPVKFIGMGERPDALQPFHPDRMSSRILGMGDMATLMEKATNEMDTERAKEIGYKMVRGEFNLNDFLNQLQQLRRMGPLAQVVEMIPGLPKSIKNEAVDDHRVKMIEAIIFSMSVQERCNPEIFNASRRRRVARGSGTSPQEVSQLLNQFKNMRAMMKKMSTSRGFPPLNKLLGR